MGDVTLLGAFVAGVLSFLSPCVLPLAPVYLAHLAGPGIWSDAPGATPATPPRVVSRRETLLHALAFVGGFSLAFIALGATASELGSALATHALLLREVGGVVLVALGLHVAGVLRLPWLDHERRLPAWRGRRGYAASLLVGLLFAIGWTPCVGPALGGILVLAAQAATLRAGVALLAIYSLGLGVPFLLLALGFERLAPRLRWLARHALLVERCTGGLLALFGVAMIANWLIVITSWVGLPLAGVHP